MKTRILWVAIAALAAAGCSKTESMDSMDKKQLIGFSAPEVGKQTKAPINGTTYPTDVPFGVFSYMVINDGTWAANKADATVFFNDMEISYQTSVWKATTGGPYYWPADAGSSLSFICYSPKSITGVSYDKTNSDGLTVTDYVNNGSTDLMYSNEIADKKSGTVSPQFNHALTQIYFAVRTASDYVDATVKITSIKLNDIISKGTFKANPSGAAAWTLDGATTAAFTVYDDATGVVATDTETNIGDALVMIPQADLASQTQKVTVTYELTTLSLPVETVTKELTLSGEWARNAKIKYLLTLSLNEIIYSPTINAWDTESNGTMN